MLLPVRMLIELWMHLGSLESPQEARVALGVTLALLSCSPNNPCASITRYTHARHEPILLKISCCGLVHLFYHPWQYYRKKKKIVGITMNQVGQIELLRMNYFKILWG